MTTTATNTKRDHLPAAGVGYGPQIRSAATHRHRDPAAREVYVQAALSQIPRLLGAIDRNPFRATYGCLDRQFWHYRTADFPSEMYQEGALPLAVVYAHDLPGNRWFGEQRVRELAIAAMRFAARSCHRDGSCDDYYPYERALGAAVFSLQAAARAYELLRLDDAEIIEWLVRRAIWVRDHFETGRLANHHALAALGLVRVARIADRRDLEWAAQKRVELALSWQSPEGWFEEYGGADPGYQTVTIDCLAKYQRIVNAPYLDEPLRRAVEFARWFLHPDDSYAGHYGSRGTFHFYPDGMELLSGGDPNAAALADGFLRALAAGKHGYFDDDRLVAHRLGNLIEAYLDYQNIVPQDDDDDAAALAAESSVRDDMAPAPVVQMRHFLGAGLFVRRTDDEHIVISSARGGVFKHFADGRLCTADAGLLIGTDDGRLALSQWHDLTRPVELDGVDVSNGRSAVSDANDALRMTISGPLYWSRFETVTPLKLILLRTVMGTVGRWFRNGVRHVLQRRLITSRRTCPLRLTRTFEFATAAKRECSWTLRVTDEIEITERRLVVKRMAFGSDHEAAYVAASGVYQDAVLVPWCDLQDKVDELNRERRITIVRQW